ncbi:hypothetical protein D3C76_1420660 [compost metagenome]
MEALDRVSKIMAGLRKYRYRVNNGFTSSWVNLRSKAPAITGMEMGTITWNMVLNTAANTANGSSSLTCVLFKITKECLSVQDP